MKKPILRVCLSSSSWNRSLQCQIYPPKNIKNVVHTVKKLNLKSMKSDLYVVKILAKIGASWFFPVIKGLDFETILIKELIKFLPREGGCPGQFGVRVADIPVFPSRSDGVLLLQ